MSAREQARAVLLEVDAVVPHVDADGLAAGAIALRARGESAEAAVLLGRGETPFGPDAPLPGGAVAVLDWGVRPVFRPGLIVDHHAPETSARPGQLIVSGYGERPEATTAALMRRIAPDGLPGSPRSARSATSERPASPSPRPSAPRAAPSGGWCRS